MDGFNRVYIVSEYESGEEWWRIRGVYLSRANAEDAVKKLEKRFSMKHEFEVDEYQILDAGGAEQ